MIGSVEFAESLEKWLAGRYGESMTFDVIPYEGDCAVCVKAHKTYDDDEIFVHTTLDFESLEVAVTENAGGVKLWFQQCTDLEYGFTDEQRSALERHGYKINELDSICREKQVDGNSPNVWLRQAENVFDELFYVAETLAGEKAGLYDGDD